MSNGIAQARGKAVLLKAGGNTNDIVTAVLDTVPEVRSQTKGFARKFDANYAGMRELWRWVKNNIRYIEDPLGVQWIREPARLWQDREGDCKSFTVFIVSVLENLNVKYYIRFANTEDARTRTVNHVYPVAIIGGKEVIMDAVYASFDREYPFYNAVDYTMTEIYRLSGIGATTQAKVVVDQLSDYAQKIQAAVSDIPDHVADTEDITQMTDGEFARFQSAQLLEAQAAHSSNTNAVRYQAAAEALRQGSISGIGNLAAADRSKLTTYLAQTRNLTERAFMAPVLEIPDAVSGDHRIAGILDAIKDGWKSLVNWLFKSGFAGSSPFMLYMFLKKKDVGPNTAAKAAKAGELMRYNMETGQFKDEYTIMQALRIGIVKNMGKQPEAVLNEAVAGKAAIAGEGGWVKMAMQALTVVWDIIKKIAALFKKKKAPEVTKADAPDETELAAEVKASLTKGAKSAPGAGGGDMDYMPIVIGGVALVGLYLLTNKN